jgi:hypothetical protein
VQIKYNNKKFYGVIENENDTITQNDLVVNYCGVIGKISHVGNKMAIVMLANHPNFSIPITFENNKDNIGLYSFNKNKILEIKQQNIYNSHGTQSRLIGVGFHSKHTFLYLHKTVATVFLSKKR